MAVRPATGADLATIRDVWLDADGVTHGRDRSTVLPLHAHELATGTLLVYERGGDIIGFGALTERDGVAFLADLFVRPSAQSQGVGRALLDALYGAHPHAERATVASSDPRAGALYRAFGMHERFTVHYLSSGAPWRGANPLRTVPCPVDDDLAALDEQLYGRCRRVDLDYWAGLGAHAAVFHSHGDPVGYALVCPHTPWHPAGDAARIGPVIARDADVAVPVVLSALGFAAALPDRAAATSTTVPEGHPATTVLFDAGFTGTDRDVFMSSRDGLVDPHRTMFTPDLL